jgi:hypothetical protein
MQILPIEVSRQGEQFRVWFGTWATKRERYFDTAVEALAFANAQWLKMPSRHLLIEPGIPL